MKAADEGMDESEAVDSPEEESAEPTDVHIPEDWQKQAQALVEGANEHQLSYLQSCISECRSKSAKKDMEFSTENMPS